MSETVSEHQVRVYEYAKVRLGRWFTVQELSTDANIPDASAKNHAVRFEEMGIFDRMRASPAHLFRLSEFAGTRDPKTVRRLDAAIPVFAERRQDRLQRELRALGLGHHMSNVSINDAPRIIEAAAVESATNAPSTGRPSTLLVQDVTQSIVDADIGIVSISRDVTLAKTPMVGVAAQTTEAPRGTKVDLLLSMVSRDQGASLNELVAALGNLPHSIRASISVESRKRGLKIECVSGRYYLRSAV